MEGGGGSVTGEGGGPFRGALWEEGPLAQLLQCDVCLAPMTSARLLPCAHSFCSTCLESHVCLNTTSRRYRGVRQKTFPCPSCRQPTVLPLLGVSGLPPDFRLTRATDVIAQLMKSPPRLCDVCRLGSSGRLEPAASFCPDCLQYFCRACAARHDVSDVLQGHGTVTLTPTTPLTSYPDPPTCPRHPFQHAPFSCSTCSHAVCLLCVLLDCSAHRVTSPSHSGVRHEQSGGLRQSLMQVDHQICQLQERIFMMTCLEGSLASSYDSARCHIRRHTRSLVVCLRSKGKQLSARLEALYAAQRDALYQEREDLREELRRLEARQGQITALLRTASLPELRSSLSHMLLEEEERDRDILDTARLQQEASTQRGNSLGSPSCSLPVEGYGVNFPTQERSGHNTSLTDQNPSKAERASSTSHSFLLNSSDSTRCQTAACNLTQPPRLQEIHHQASFVHFVPGSLETFGDLQPIRLTADTFDLSTAESFLAKTDNLNTSTELPKEVRDQTIQDIVSPSACPKNLKSSSATQLLTSSMEGAEVSTNRSSKYRSQFPEEQTNNDSRNGQTKGNSQKFLPRQPQPPGIRLYPGEHDRTAGANSKSRMEATTAPPEFSQRRANLSFDHTSTPQRWLTTPEPSTSFLASGAPPRTSPMGTGGRLIRPRSLSALHRLPDFDLQQPFPHLQQTRQRETSRPVPLESWTSSQQDHSQATTGAFFLGVRRERGDSGPATYLSIDTANHLKHSSSSERRTSIASGRDFDVRLRPAHDAISSRRGSSPVARGRQTDSRGHQTRLQPAHDAISSRRGSSPGNVSRQMDTQGRQMPRASPCPAPPVPRVLVSSAGLGEVKARLLARVGGQGRGRLSFPCSLCFTQDNSLAVAENGNGRIQLIDVTGNCRSLLTKEGMAPRGVASLPGGRLLVADEGRRRALLFSLVEPHQACSIPLPATAFPFGVATNAEGWSAWTDLVFARVTLLSPSDPQDRSLQCQGSRLDSPGHVALDGSKIYVSDSNQHKVKVFSLQDGHFLFEFGSQGSLPGQLCYPKSLAVDSAGRVWVADSGNSRVSVYDHSGRYLATPLDHTQGLDRPSGLALSLLGHLAVSLPDLDTVLIYQLNPQF